MEIVRSGYSTHELEEYGTLFSACFPDARKLSNLEYLRWLYAANPSGPVVGYDARDGGRLVAHYACVPADVAVDGRTRRGLLSLNTATHPEFQGRGLFTLLAEETYTTGANEGFECVYGVANANSTPGFVRKLGFTLVSPLESRLGVAPLGRLDWHRLDEFARFRRAWTDGALTWRVRNPAAAVQAQRLRSGVLGFSAPTGRRVVRAWAEMPAIAGLTVEHRVAHPSPRVWLGLLPAGLGRARAYAQVPERLRPSPLNMIVRGLADPITLHPSEVFFNFLDFDAF